MLTMLFLGGMTAALNGSLRFSAESRGPADVNTEIHLNRNAQYSQSTEIITVMTLNLAHGRSTGFHQAVTPMEKITANLDEVAAVLQREKPQIVGLQEADGPSIWSGKFNHVHHLAGQASYPNSALGKHVSGWDLNYGTAILSQLPMAEARSISFSPTPPIPSKGFLKAKISHPRWKNGINVISIHLDFASRKKRLEQAEILIEHLKKESNRPMIIMGDFNTKWIEDDALVHIAKELSLHAMNPMDNSNGTFSKTNERLDWILISEDLEFTENRILQDRISDHFGVIAKIRPAHEDMK